MLRRAAPLTGFIPARSLRADALEAANAEAGGGGELLHGPAVLSHLVASLLAAARRGSAGAAEAGLPLPRISLHRAGLASLLACARRGSAGGAEAGAAPRPAPLV